MKTKKIKITISGKTPLLCNRFTDEAQMKASGTITRLVSQGNLSPKEAAEQCLYVGLDGKTLIIPQPNLFRCIIDAGKFFKSGKSKVSTQKNSLIPACVEIEGVELPIITKEGWGVDTRPVRIPATGGRILKHRPVFNDWQLKFVAEIDLDFISEQLFRDIIDAAGKRIGLGDFRPDCKGPFGKFQVVSWD